MPLHATDHSWYTSNRLQEDDSVEPATLIEFVWVISRNQIKRPAGARNQEHSEAVANALRRLVSVLYLLYFLLGVDRMSHAIALGVQHELVLDHLVQKSFTLLRHLLNRHYESLKAIVSCCFT